MNPQTHDEQFTETTVTYSIDIDGQFILIENVPARVSVETGEEVFSPSVVERLQRVAWGEQKPTRMIQTPVFEYAT